MRIAIITVTERGLRLAERIGGQIFHKGRDFDRLGDFIAEVFGKFDALVFICATGIVVRVIAAHIVSKLSDPAVIVIDERGRNVISLLSGHVGGANELALKISAQIGANPIITTATDVGEKFAADSFIARLGLTPVPKDAIKAINSAVLRGESVYLSAGGVKLNLIPQRLILGIGCRRGTSIEDITAAVGEACRMIGQPLSRISLIASVDVKRNEAALLKFAENLGVGIKFFGVDELARKVVEYKLTESEFVKEIIGVGNVCEAAALCCVQSARFALNKTAFKGVTIALVWEK